MPQVLASDPRHYTLQYCGAQRTVTVDSPAAAALARYMPEPQVEDFSKVRIPYQESAGPRSTAAPAPGPRAAQVVRSPMPGTLVSVSVAAGDVVAPGDEVAVVSAMKMRLPLRAAVGGRVAAVEAAQGAVVAADQTILRLE